MKIKKNNLILLSIILCLTLTAIGCAAAGNDSLRAETEETADGKLKRYEKGINDFI